MDPMKTQLGLRGFPQREFLLLLWPVTLKVNVNRKFLSVSQFSTSLLREDLLEKTERSSQILTKVNVDFTCWECTMSS